MMIPHVTRMGEEVDSEAFSEREVAKIFSSIIHINNPESGSSEGQSLPDTHT